MRRFQGSPRLSPAQPSPAPILLLLISPCHHQVLILVLIFNLSLHLISRQPEQQPSLDKCTTSPLPSAPSTSSEPCCLRAQAPSNHFQIFTEQTAASQGNSTRKSKQSKCHSHYILITLQSLQMTLTCYVTKHPTSYVPSS